MESSRRRVTPLSCPQLSGPRPSSQVSSLDHQCPPPPAPVPDFPVTHWSSALLLSPTYFITLELLFLSSQLLHHWYISGPDIYSKEKLCKTFKASRWLSLSCSESLRPPFLSFESYLKSLCVSPPPLLTDPLTSVKQSNSWDLANRQNPEAGFLDASGFARFQEKRAALCFSQQVMRNQGFLEWRPEARPPAQGWAQEREVVGVREWAALSASQIFLRQQSMCTPVSTQEGPSGG